MKRAAILMTILPAALGLPGCPVYGDSVCDSNAECAPGLVCHYASGRCLDPADLGGGGTAPPACSEPADCRSGETCTPEGRCLPGSCAFHGCVEGYECEQVEGIFECAVAGPIDGGSDASSKDGSTGSDAGDGSVAPDAGERDAASDAPLFPDASRIDGAADGASDSGSSSDSAPATDAGGDTGAGADGSITPRDASPADAMPDSAI